MIGIYQEADQVHEVHPPVIIFEEFGEIVILTYDSNARKYSETSRKELLQTGDIRTHKTKDYVVGGQVLVFDQETQSYQKEYEGQIFGINPTNHSLVGEKGWSLKIKPS